MKTGLIKKLLSGTALAATLAGGAMADDNQPVIKGMSLYPSVENPVSMKLDIYFPTNGNYRIVCRPDLTSTNEVPSNYSTIAVKYPKTTVTRYETLGPTNKLFYSVQSK